MTNPTALAQRPAQLPPSEAETTESLIRRLISVGEISLHEMPNGDTWCSVRPRSHSTLWWHGIAPTLSEALAQCEARAVDLRFLPPQQASTRAVTA
jgi:hypothetical protein